MTYIGSISRLRKFEFEILLFSDALAWPFFFEALLIKVFVNPQIKATKISEMNIIRTRPLGLALSYFIFEPFKQLLRILIEFLDAVRK